MNGDDLQLVSFEAFFKALKSVLHKPDLFEIWPDFEPVYDEEEYSWADLDGIGFALIFNCGSCDGPCDTRHLRCGECVKGRRGKASEAYMEYTSRKRRWDVEIMCRIYGNVIASGEKYELVDKI